MLLSNSSSVIFAPHKSKKIHTETDWSAGASELNYMETDTARWLAELDSNQRPTAPQNTP